MQEQKQHIIFRLLSLILVVSIAWPSVVKLDHFLDGHEHVICIDNTSTHIHDLEIECEFFKFKLSEVYSTPIFGIAIILLIEKPYQLQDYYLSFNPTQHTTQFLRGPPALV